MPTFPDKSQRPQESAQAKCTACEGKGYVKSASGKNELCVRCRGSGKAGGYMTK